MKPYERLALQWAEKYGIIEYKVKGSKMIYYQNYKEGAGINAWKPGYKGETYKTIIDLKTMTTESRTMLKRYNEKGWYNT